MKKRTTRYNCIPDIATIKELVKYGASKGPDKKYVIYHDGNGVEQTKTFGETLDNTNRLGTFLFREGFRDSKIAVIAENSYAWMVLFFSVLLGRNVFVPLDCELPAEELADKLVDCGCDALFYSQKFSDKIKRIQATEKLPVRRYYSIAGIDGFMAEGEKALTEGYNDFIEQVVKPDDLACIVYTSGTTGRSKGVMLTHGNLASNVVASCRCLSGRNTVGFLPMNHTFSWISSIFAGFVYTEYGYLCQNYKDVSKAFVQYSPQNFSAVPMVVEKIYNTIWRSAEKSGRAQALQKGLKISRFLMKLGIDKRRAIFRQVHERLGGNLELIVCGGAALDRKYEEDLYYMGIAVLNGYGITECSPAVTVNRPDNFRFGSVGLPMPCNEVKIVDPDEEGVGEIYVRGSNVMAGYYNDPEATAQVFDGDWFKTGDFGRMDKDGFLYYVGRKKNRIVLPNGKNISPEELEDKLMTVPFVKEVIVYEEDKLIAAEFYLDEEAVPEARQRLNDVVEEFNNSLPLYKRIRKIKIRDTEFPKTTTLKIRRQSTQDDSGQEEKAVECV